MAMAIDKGQLILSTCSRTMQLLNSCIVWLRVAIRINYSLIVHYPTPVKGVRSLFLASFHQCFIHKLAEIIAPLHNLTGIVRVFVQEDKH